MDGIFQDKNDSGSFKDNEWTGEIPKRLSVKPEKTRCEGTSFAVKAGAGKEVKSGDKRHYELNIKESVDERIDIFEACF